MYEKNLINFIALSIWALVIVIYITVSFVIIPLAESYKYYKIQKDTAIWAEEFTRERRENPEKYNLINTDNVTDMRPMFQSLKFIPLELDKYSTDSIRDLKLDFQIPNDTLLNLDGYSTDCD